MKENGKNVLLLDAGDLLFGKYVSPPQETEIMALTQKAQLIIESFNMMGYDAVGIGDDDLTLGKAFLVGAAKKALFPILASNLLDEDSGKPLFQTSLIKEVQGLRIGIFSLLSADAFLGQGDGRKKGIILASPTDTARSILKELQPKTDLIVLLSHLGYPKDMELAQSVPGIHMIVGSHTGLHLTNPPVVQNTVILQAGTKGMSAAKMEVVLHPHETTFYNIQTKRSLENNLNNLRLRLLNSKIPGQEKTQLLKTKEDTERRLAQLQGKNEFTNTISPLTEQMNDLPEIVKLIDAYHARFPEPAHAPPK